MIAALYIIGVIAIIISAVAGFLSGTVLGFLISVGGGISSAVVLFALVRILENQEDIFYMLQQNQEIVARKFKSQGMKVCSKCNYKYESDSTSCPHCGYRD